MTELFDAYLAHLHDKRASHQAIGHHRISARRATPILGSLSPQDLTRRHHDKLVSLYQAAGLAPRTVQLYTKRIQMAVRYAVRMGWLTHYPWSECKPPAAPQRPKDWVRLEEWDAFLQALPERWQFGAAWLAATGGRISAALRVQWPDVDLRRGTAVIRRAKGGKGRVVPILPPLLPAIQAEYLRQGRPERGRVCKCSVEWLRRQIIQASKRALRRTVKPHDLRRTYAIWARDAGVPIHLVSLALGHHSVAITEQWYLEADAHQVVDGFKEAFGQVGRRQRKEMEQ